jgi:hypothetical protein
VWWKNFRRSRAKWPTEKTAVAQSSSYFLLIPQRLSNKFKPASPQGTEDGTSKPVWRVLAQWRELFHRAERRSFTCLVAPGVAYVRPLQFLVHCFHQKS